MEFACEGQEPVPGSSAWDLAVQMLNSASSNRIGDCNGTEGGRRWDHLPVKGPGACGTRLGAECVDRLVVHKDRRYRGFIGDSAHLSNRITGVECFDAPVMAILSEGRGDCL